MSAPTKWIPVAAMPVDWQPGQALASRPAAAAPAPAAKWLPVGWFPPQRPGQRPRAAAWASAAHPGVEIRHCGHPTALRPYYLAGRIGTRRKFSQLQQAQEAVRRVDAGEVEADDLETADLPLKHRRSQW
jgi:hypothetical protein